MRQDSNTFSSSSDREEEFSSCFPSVFGKMMCIPLPSLVIEVHSRQHLLGMTCKPLVPKIRSLINLGASHMLQKTGKLCSCNIFDLNILTRKYPKDKELAGYLIKLNKKLCTRSRFGGN